jgi:hypothetical protein
MNKQLENQLNNELNKAFLALDWEAKPGRANQYNTMMVSDVKSLMKIYGLMLCGEMDKAVRKLVGLDTDVYEKVPVKILNYFETY